MPAEQGENRDGRRALDIGRILESLIPPSIYSSKTKKFFGVIGAEDLLLIALIFLFLENDEKKDPTMLLALIYILVSDYVDWPEFSW